MLAALDRALGRCTWWRSASPATRRREAADGLYEELARAGVEVLLDDRDAGPGEKLTDAELLGCPLRLVVGRRGAGRGRGRGAGPPHGSRRAPARSRRRPSGATSPSSADEWAHRLGACFGLDRSRPRPPQTRRGEPLRPFTLPNLVGYIRLAGIPVFLYLALELLRRPHGGLGAALPGDRRPATTSTASWPGHRPVQPHGRAARPGRRSADHPRRGSSSAGSFELLPRWALAILAAQRARHAGAGPARLCDAASTSRSTGSGGSPCALIMGGIFLAHGVDWLDRRTRFLRWGRLTAIAARTRSLYVEHAACAKRARAADQPGRFAAEALNLNLNLCVGAYNRRRPARRTPPEGAREWRKPFPTSAR